MNIEITKARPADLGDVLELLSEASLPREEVAEHFSHYLVAKAEGKVVGAVGMEHYGSSALLRSLVVSAPYRSRGLGRVLVERILEAARGHGVKRAFLLTETAANFFPKFGFRKIAREEADSEVQGSVEFRTACCQSAVCMVLDL